MPTFDDQVEMTVAEGVAVLTLSAVDGELPWGTKHAEHRWNPVLVGALHKALDAVEKNDECCCVVVGNAGKFWSNGMDLKFLDSATDEENAAHEKRTNELMVRVMTFGIPTVAAISGHFCAAGGMMGLCFDYRIMSSDRGFFFIPGIDIGLVYSPLQVRAHVLGWGTRLASSHVGCSVWGVTQTAVMTTKLPAPMHREGRPPAALSSPSLGIRHWLSCAWR